MYFRNSYIFRVFGAIVFSAISAGQASSFAPDYGKAKAAAARIFHLLDQHPAIDTQSTAGDTLVKTFSREPVHELIVVSGNRRRINSLYNAEEIQNKNLRH